MGAEASLWARGWKAALATLFPPACLSCGEQVAEEGGLCPACWRDAEFCAGLVCDLCGLPLLGSDEGRRELCDECERLARPWSQGRAALLYRGTGRRLVQALKFHDRLELGPPLGAFIARAARPILRPDMLVTPVPLHRLRLFRRKFNQSALLSSALARAAGLEHCPDLLARRRATRDQEGLPLAARFENLSGAFTAARPTRIAGRHILLVDDVMTTGATLAAAAEACLAAGAQRVSVATLARVAKDL